MADTSIMCSQVEMLQKAGANVSPTLNAATDTLFVYSNAFIGQAESQINNVCRFNFSDAFTAGLNADVKALLTEVASNLAAIYCINFDMGGYSSRTEAENMVNILRDSALRGLSLLRDKKVQTFINGA